MVYLEDFKKSEKNLINLSIFTQRTSSQEHHIYSKCTWWMQYDTDLILDLHFDLLSFVQERVASSLTRNI